MSFASSRALFPGLFLLSFLLLSAPPALASKHLAIFVQGDLKNQASQATAAQIAWLLRSLSFSSAQAKAVLPLDRGLFFSRAEALASQNWQTRAASSSNEGFPLYQTDPGSAVDHFFRTSRYFEFSHPYALDVAAYQKALFFLGLLLLRKGGEDKSKGLEAVESAILLQPNAPLPDVGSTETQILQAARCTLGQKSPASLVVETYSPDAEIYVNEKLVGFGRIDMNNLRPGTYMVKVMRDGYRHSGRRLTLRSGKKQTLRLRNRPGPRLDMYEKLCSKLLAISDPEQLHDEMKKLADSLRTKQQEVKHFFTGCFFPDASGQQGRLQWFLIHTDGGKAEKGITRIPAELPARQKALASLVQKLGFSPLSKLPSLPHYEILTSKGSCQDPLAVEVAALSGPKKAPPVWTIAQDDPVMVYTHYGFRLQGRVASIDGEILTLEVSSSKNDPPELRLVKIPRSTVKWTFILGAKQEGGYRVGERVIIETVYGINLIGVLAADDGDRIRLQTSQGMENLPWSMIRRVIHRDR